MIHSDIVTADQLYHFYVTVMYASNLMQGLRGVLSGQRLLLLYSLLVTLI